MNAATDNDPMAVTHNEGTAGRDDRGLQIGLSVVACAILCYLFTSYRIGENEQTVGVFALLIILIARPAATLSPWPWLVVLVAMLVALARRPLDVPNHHYMISYLTAAIALSLTAPVALREATLRTNVRWLMVVLMAFATVHKLASPTFRDGSYLGYEITRGGFGDPVLPLLEAVDERARQNDLKIAEFRGRLPSEGDTVKLEPLSPYPRLVALGFALAIVGVELLLFLGFLVAPNRLVSHLLLISFIVALGVLRQEFTFISVVAAMGMLACEPKRGGLRLTYAALSVATAAAILKTLN